MRKIEPLSKSHDRENFDCGNEALNAFLKHTARQHAERGISKTIVLVEENASDPKPILGYFSLNICQIKSEALPSVEAQKLPRDVSGTKVGRLAVSKQLKRQGIGRILYVDLEPRTITWENPKGGRERGFTAPMRDELVPLFTRLIDERGRGKTAYDFDGLNEWEKPSKLWWRFFKQNEELNLPHLCFHCTRVTFITRGAKQGIPQSKMMKLVNHASDEIHRIDQRLEVPDVRNELNAIKFPPAIVEFTHPASRIRGVRRPNAASEPEKAATIAVRKTVELSAAGAVGTAKAPACGNNTEQDREQHTIAKAASIG